MFCYMFRNKFKLAGTKYNVLELNEKGQNCFVTTNIFP